MTTTLIATPFNWIYYSLVVIGILCACALVWYSHVLNVKRRRKTVSVQYKNSGNNTSKPALSYTYADVVNMLPTAIREKAKKYRNDQRWQGGVNFDWGVVCFPSTSIDKHPIEFLAGCFNFEASDEGLHYWVNVIKAVKHGNEIRFDRYNGYENTEIKPFPEKINQRKAIQNILERDGFVDTRYCRVIHLYRIRKVIYSMKKKGYVFKTQIGYEKGKKYAIYTLIHGPEIDLK